MREIKFRAWHAASENINPVMLFDNKPGDCFRWLGEHQPVTIMQYTNLKDKNGKEIYEGDLVEYRINGEYPAEVYFDERDSGYRLRVNGEMQHDKTYPMLFALRVVGNIYENPELLKEI